MNKKFQYVGIAAGIAGILASTYAFKKRKAIKEEVKSDISHLAGVIKEKSATTLHNKVGYPVYNFIKKKENIPF